MATFDTTHILLCIVGLMPPNGDITPSLIEQQNCSRPFLTEGGCYLKLKEIENTPRTVFSHVCVAVNERD
jgi:hypothetical protein